MNSHRALILGAAIAAALFQETASAEKLYDPGADDTQIKIGNVVPYSGPVSIYGRIGEAEQAYFKMINDQGGINGRKVVFISYDDAYSPPKTFEQVRRLIESDEVLAVFGIIGTPTNSAVMKYLNAKKVPQLFVGSGAEKFNDPKNAHWTMGLAPSYRLEAQTYAKHILAENPNAKIAILYQNDDFGREYLAGLKAGLGEAHASMLVAEGPFETSQPTIDSVIVNLKASGADALVIAGIGKFASQALRKTAELNWNVARYMTNTAISIDSVLKPAGTANAAGVISATYKKDFDDPTWAGDPGVIAFGKFIEKYDPEGGKTDAKLTGYLAAQALEHVLRQGGDNLTRANVMKEAANLVNVQLDMLLPGISLTTSPTAYAPLKQLQLMRFDGVRWNLLGSVVGD